MRKSKIDQTTIDEIVRRIVNAAMPDKITFLVPIFMGCQDESDIKKRVKNGHLDLTNLSKILTGNAMKIGVLNLIILK